MENQDTGKDPPFPRGRSSCGIFGGSRRLPLTCANPTMLQVGQAINHAITVKNISDQGNVEPALQSVAEDLLSNFKKFYDAPMLI